MTGQIVAVLSFLAVVVGVPLLLLLWAQRARMYSGRALRYDGPRHQQGVRVDGDHEVDRSPEVYAPATPQTHGGAGEEAGLSSAEQEQWEQLVNVSWELPSGRDERA